MCGIYGMVSVAARPLQHPEHADVMRRSLAHRGPDGHGCLSHPHAVIGVNRLRIIDRRSRADQPFADPAGQVWLAVNGEIYNAGEIRSRFPAYPYRSGADSETILPLYLARGALGLAELEGMFAVAVWDERNRTLTLARDRAGEKPLFLGERDGEIWFASEIQALLEGRTRPCLDSTALAEVVRLGYPLEPRTIWTGITRVEAGTIVTFGPEGRTANRYWNPCTVHGAPCTVAPSAEEAADELADLLRQSVRKQVVADVPVGVFTSGGLDSALLTSIAADQIGGDRLHTFTVRFPDASYDEGAVARRVAARFHTRHVEANANEAALRSALDAVIGSIAEPITDPAILPTLILARAAREQVGVVLSGEGADELFGGYPTYVGHKLVPWFNRLPFPARRLAIEAINRWPSSRRKVTLEFLLKRFVAGAELPWFERHVAWFGTGLPEDVLAGAGSGERGATVDYRSLLPAPRSPLADAMLWDYTTYLRDLLLPKIDRATSLVALESRAPYLDAGLTRFAHALPADYRVRGLTTKWLLRRAARRWLPGAIVNRRKRGLSVPIAAWLNGGLSSAVDRVLEPARLARQGLLNPRAVRHLVGEHRRGNLALSRGLWTLFILERWMEHWMPEETG